MLPTHGRYAYAPWPARPRYAWPGGAKLAVYLGVNLEHFAFGEGLGAELAPGGPQPDVLNFAWRDYGNRVGAWRLLELLDQLRLPATVLINSALYDYAPQLAAAHRGARRRDGRAWPHQQRAPVRAARGRRTGADRRERPPPSWRMRARRHAAGSPPGSPKAAPRPTCWPRPATATP